MKPRALCLCTGLLLAFGSTELVAQIVLKSTYPGKSARSFITPDSNLLKFDFNDDGILDQPLMEEEGIYYFLTIIDGANPENFWILPDPGDEVALDFSRASVVGFYEFDPTNDLKEIVLAERKGRHLVNPFVIDVEGNVLWHITDGTSNTVLLTITNMEADITEEVVVFNPQIPQVEIWGVQND